MRTRNSSQESACVFHPRPTSGQAVLAKIDTSSVPGRIILDFDYTIVRLEAFADRAGWDRALVEQIGSKCPGIARDSIS